jgi:hypothetical protein
LTSSHQAGYVVDMRTTVDLDEDVLRVVKHLAQEREQSLGRVLSDLVKRGLGPRGDIAVSKGFIPVLPRKPGARPVTSQHVRELLESED